jgi:hypothetical protein
MLVPELQNIQIPVVDAMFSKAGDPPYFWTENIDAANAKIGLTLSDFGDPILVHSRPNEEPNKRLYGVCTVLVPALASRLTLNGVQAKGYAWPRDRLGRPYSTCGLGLSESWTEER